MNRGEAITQIYALFNAPHNADINLAGLNKVLDDLVAEERARRQGQIETLHAMYELASRQRDELMDQQRAEIMSKLGRLQ